LAEVHFDFIASNYEGMYQRMGWPDPKMCAKMVHKFIKKNEMNPSEVSVLDYACGTGLVGQYLSEYGCKKIDGLDISANMLEQASNKCVYRDLTQHTLGEDPDALPQRFKNQHDFVTCSGLINNNHQDYLIFEEMLLSCKKGGYVIFAARYSMMGKYWYDNIIKEMADQGRWTLVATETFFKYDEIPEISIGRYSKTPCKVFVFKNGQDEINTYVNAFNIKMKQFLLNKFKSGS